MKTIVANPAQSLIVHDEYEIAVPAVAIVVFIPAILASADALADAIVLLIFVSFESTCSIIINL